MAVKLYQDAADGVGELLVELDQYCTTAKVIKQDNADYYMELEIPLVDEESDAEIKPVIDAARQLLDAVKPNRLIRTDLPGGAQTFRIASAEQTKQKITCKAWHVFYDIKNYVVPDFTVDKLLRAAKVPGEAKDGEIGCNAAIQGLFALAGCGQFKVFSDIDVSNKVEGKRVRNKISGSCRTLFECMQLVIETWGGYLVRDNFTIRIVSGNEGKDSGVKLEDGSNSADVTVSEKWDEVCTVLYPVGKDGLTLAEDRITPKAIEAANVNEYPRRYVRTQTFSQTIEDKDYKDSYKQTRKGDYYAALQADLRDQASAWLSRHCRPETNYTVKITNAYDDEEESPEWTRKVFDVGQLVRIKDSLLGIDRMDAVLSFTYDCLVNEYTEAEFGTHRKHRLSELK